jgi:hypothetical protein
VKQKYRKTGSRNGFRILICIFADYKTQSHEENLFAIFVKPEFLLPVSRQTGCIPGFHNFGGVWLGLRA